MATPQGSGVKKNERLQFNLNGNPQPLEAETALKSWIVFLQSSVASKKMPDDAVKC